jgi:3-hydroxyisobutyryl-CoA hydrolase
VAILNALKQVAGETKDDEVRIWANKTIETIRDRSPIGVSVTLKALRLGKTWNIAQAFQNEYAIASVFMKHPDFVTGVTARLIERSKGRPNWAPAQLEQVTTAQVDAFFTDINSPDPLKLLVTGPRAVYNQYPHSWIALPGEGHIRAQLKDNNGDVEVTLKKLLEVSGNKVGVKEKVAYVSGKTLD